MGFEPLSHRARMKCYQVTLYGPFKYNKFKELCAIGGIEPNPYLTPIHIHCLELYTFG